MRALPTRYSSKHEFFENRTRKLCTMWSESRFGGSNPMWIYRKFDVAIKWGREQDCKIWPIAFKKSVCLENQEVLMQPIFSTIVAEGIKVFSREGSSYYHSYNISLFGKSLECKENNMPSVMGFEGTPYVNVDFSQISQFIRFLAGWFTKYILSIHSCPTEKFPKWKCARKNYICFIVFVRIWNKFL